MNIKTSNFLAHLLVVDDDDRIRSLLQKYLFENNYLITVAKDAIDAELLLKNIKYDLIITDKMMPEKDGVEFVKDIRNLNNNTPVIMLTAMGDIENKIQGFENGVDDYIAKPFEPKELLFRIANILKRTKQIVSDTIKFGDFSFNKKSEVLKKNDMVVKLTTEQQKIMNFFMDNIDKVITREEFVKILDSSDERSIDVAITRLRKKIETENNKYIITVRNVGYKFSI
ncbi:MAG: response regulator transcription factor [Alphaproteobacteria bacterium]|nr:response regulator transcription factor [Alphaproteobacteria bacterium]MBQ8660250.1 response regulator transcription factor [Alphaproteobacteria bacterium]